MSAALLSQIAPLLSAAPVAASLPPQHSWLKFCPSCSSGKPAVHAPLMLAMRAVNCWFRFHSELESARQQSKAFALTALKLRWNAMGLLM